jgi:hypothetical protein
VTFKNNFFSIDKGVILTIAINISYHTIKSKEKMYIGILGNKKSYILAYFAMTVSQVNPQRKQQNDLIANIYRIPCIIVLIKKVHTWIRLFIGYYSSKQAT